MELHRLYCEPTYMQARIKNILRQILKSTVLFIGYEQKSITQLKKCNRFQILKLSVLISQTTYDYRHIVDLKKYTFLMVIGLIMNR